MNNPLPNFKKNTCNENGLIHIVIIIVILVALALGVYLVQTRTNINPFAQSISAPISGPLGDSDKDGFSDSQEFFMGTNPNVACPTSSTDNAWPVDVNNDKNINGGDVSTLVPYINGSKTYNKRYDLNQDNAINQGDVSVIQANFLKTCEAIEKTAVIRIAPKPIVKLGEEVAISVFLSAFTDDVNLVSAQINYPSDKLDVVRIEASSSDNNAGGFTNVIEKYAGNGQISIIQGSTKGVNTGGINSGVVLAKIIFKTKVYGVSDITLNKEKSEVLRVKDGANVLNPIRDSGLDASISVYPQPTPQPPLPKPFPSEGCYSNPQCAADQECRRMAPYPGNCMEQNVACAQVITKACYTLIENNTAPQEICADFSNPCVVPPGWHKPGERPTPTPIACSPRPNIGRVTSMTAQGLKVTLTPATNGNTSNNPINSISFTTFDNASVTIDGSFYTKPVTHQVVNSGGSQGITFYVNQLVLNKTTTVQMKVNDNCGPYDLFFGGGTQAGWPTTIPPIPTPNQTPQATASASITPVIACTIIKTQWVGNDSIVPSNTTAKLRVDATGNCANKRIVFNTWEDDGLLGADPVITNPQEVFLISSGQPNQYFATTTWRTEFQEDGPFGSSYPPEFSFEATIDGEKNRVRSTNQLLVAREIGAPSPVEGDTNKDQQVNLKDISWMLTFWDKKVNDEALDIDGDDNTVNNFDMAKLKGILLQRGILRPIP